jgi:paraquat-inducible protein B
MSKQASPTLIGGFVIAAAVLVIAAIVILGGGKFFVTTHQFVTVFPGSIYGLNVGAPISFRGVRVGEVKEVTLLFHGESENLEVLVTIEIREGAAKRLGGTAHRDRLFDTKDAIAWLVRKHGLRARLEMQSLVTGQLYVGLDFYPDTKIVYRAADASELPEIPTIASGLEQLGKTLESIPLDQLAAKALDALEGIDRAVNAPQVAEILKGVAQVVEEVRKLAAKMEADFEPLSQSLLEAADATGAAMAQAKTTLALREGVPGELAASLKETSDAATATLEQAKSTLALERGVPGRLAASLIEAADGAREAARAAERTLADVDGMTAEGSPIRSRLLVALEELAGAARSLRFFVDYLERNPQALLRGKR